MSTRSFRYSTLVQHFGKGRMASTDRDALAFIVAAGIYNTNQQKAIVDLVRSLKRVGLWSKMKAIYPFIGGTASSHKWNLKDPRDVDAAFRLNFVGGWTHNSNGADPNGTNAYADTYIIPSVNLSTNSAHASAYHRENRISTETYAVSLGSVDSGGSNNKFYIIPREGTPPTDTTFLTLNSTGPNDAITFADTNSSAYYIVSRTSNTLQTGYRNDTKQTTNTKAATGVNAVKIYLSAYNVAGTTLYYSFLQMAFATIGDGLTDSDATALYNIVDLYQKRLGRAV